MSILQRFRSWFEHEKTASAGVLESLDSVPPGRRDAAEYRKACDLLAHLCAARQAWLFRLGGAPDGPRTWDEIFPVGVDPASLADRCGAMTTAWDDYFARLDDEDLGRAVEYTASEGVLFRDRLENVLAQLNGHAWYHRGQIASLVKASEGTPAVTDLVFFTRERVG